MSGFSLVFSCFFIGREVLIGSWSYKILFSFYERKSLDCTDNGVFADSGGWSSQAFRWDLFIDSSNKKVRIFSWCGWEN